MGISGFINWLEEQILYSTDYWSNYDPALECYSWICITERQEILKNMEWYIDQEESPEAFVRILKNDVEYSIQHHRGNGQHTNSSFWMRPQTADKLKDAMTRYGVL